IKLFDTEVSNILKLLSKRDRLSKELIIDGICFDTSFFLRKFANLTKLTFLFFLAKSVISVNMLLYAIYNTFVFFLVLFSASINK
ncbi:hypothetical protein, partial [Acetobacter tropicalis]|uniref:hypothetical protein n=1 Tax=Acetobacter tropicalis TaxID=104102 RepID=UPI000ABC4B58